MSEAKKRKVHTPEFRAKGGLEALRGAKTINQIGQEYLGKRGFNKEFFQRRMRAKR